MGAPAAASTQVALLSLVFFCCPGLFNALSSIASGLQDATVAFRGNVLVYLLFTASSAVAAALLPTLGARRSLALGTIGYVLYTLSLWHLSVASDSRGAAALFYAASGVLGVSAGFLWTAQGQMIMSYATERNQGRYLSAFWVVFNLGATCGGLLTCTLNWARQDASHSTPGVQASDATFAAFVVVSALGVVIAVATIAPLSRVVKSDGSRVDVTHQETVATSHHRRDDFRALLAYATTSREIARLLPFFVYSNWFYTYHAFFNVAIFNTRTGGLASACYWTAQMLAALALGRWLDRSASSPRARSAGATLGMLALLWNAMWALGAAAQYSLALAYERPLALDLVDDSARVAAPLALYTLYGAGDALGQVWIYWYLSSVCANGRDQRTAGFNAGLYKSVQALSAALAWWIGAQRVAPAAQLWTNWALCNAAVAGAAWSLRYSHAQLSAREVPLEVNAHKSYLSTQA